MHHRILFLLTACMLLSGWLVADDARAAGITVVVDRTSDASDRSPGDGHCDISINAGDQCSLRAAIEELNALGADTSPHRIEFNIFGAGPHTIAPASALPSIAVPVEIDGATQPGAACPTATTAANLLIVLDGSNAGTGVDGLYFAAGSDGSTIRGMVIGDFDIHGIRLVSNANNVRCNHVGVGADGVSDIGNRLSGIFVSGNDNTIGGQSADAQHNVVSGNGSIGIRIESGDRNRIANNFVGTMADGMSALPNIGGVYITGDGNLIGGSVARARNVISGNSGFSIRINTGGTNTVIQGNLIGVARDGSTALPNTGNGIEITGDATDNLVGGIAPGEANLVANNGGRGVTVTTNINGTPARNQIRGNAMFANNSTGIDLAADGVDANDAGDGDGGENEHQNYPMLTATPGSLTISGTLDSHANSQYTIDVYRSTSCDSSGNGEGQTYLTSLAVTTNATNHADFIVNVAAAAGDSITATATDSFGNTSEFSACAILSQVATATPTRLPTATLPPGVTPTATRDPEQAPTATLPPGVTPTATRDPEQAPEYVVALPLITK